MSNLNFGGSLLAEYPVYTLTDEVIFISITSNADLSASYPAGTELKELFAPVVINRACIESPSNNTSCITDFYADSSYNSLEEALNEAMSQRIFFDQGEGQDFHLFTLSTSEEVTNNSHEIKVQFDFQSGNTIELVTSQIILN